MSYKNNLICSKSYIVSMASKAKALCDKTVNTQKESVSSINTYMNNWDCLTSTKNKKK